MIRKRPHVSGSGRDIFSSGGMGHMKRGGGNKPCAHSNSGRGERTKEQGEGGSPPRNTEKNQH